jgi:formylglycine-generating enzyme required for sulfatase activity
MKRRRIILVSLVAVLTAAAGVVAWRLSVLAATPIPMVEVPAGKFLMGSPEIDNDREDDEIRHWVEITYAFKMGKTEVTQKQWRKVMGTTILQQRNMDSGVSSSFGRRVEELGHQIGRDPYAVSMWIWRSGIWKTIKWLLFGDAVPGGLCGKGDDYPMYYVNWDEAMVFCALLTEQEKAAGRLSAGYEYRLPTEAEWEYACRAGSTTRFANGDTEICLSSNSWYDANSRWDCSALEGPCHPVGTIGSNAWGIYDMHGNVGEWCLDWYDDYPGEVVDPFGPNTGSLRIHRGGSWDDMSRNCRSAYRAKDVPGLRRYTLGFRVVLAPVRPR